MTFGLPICHPTLSTLSCARSSFLGSLQVYLCQTVTQSVLLAIMFAFRSYQLSGVAFPHHPSCCKFIISSRIPQTLLLAASCVIAKRLVTVTCDPHKSMVEWHNAICAVTFLQAQAIYIYLMECTIVQISCFLLTLGLLIDVGYLLP